MEQKHVSFVDAVKRALTVNYFNFEGRASRSEYWWFSLFTFLCSAILMAIFGDGTFGSILRGLVSLALFIPSLGLSVRRMHDINRSGWWILIALVPIVGWIIYIVWACKQSDVNPNQYGPVPNCE